MPFRLLFFILFFGIVSAFGQSFDKYTLSSDSTVNRLASIKKVYYTTRIDKRPKIDGKLNDPCWETSGFWADGFVQQVPNQGKDPSQKTEIKLLYDNNNLYVGFKCYDKGPGKITPILKRRDNDAAVGDIVGIAIDSYHDNQTAYEFNVTAAGQKIDFVHMGSNDLDYNWDAIWDGKSQVYDSIWTSELQIPFSQIRFAPKNEQVWGIHPWRWLHRLEEKSQWKLIPVDAPAEVYLYSELRGLDGIKPKTNYEFLPYLNVRYNPNTDLENKTTYGAGLNGKVGLNSGFNLDYALNPDFGQVEADPSVLNLTSYEVFNEEKRPFFLEGNTVFDYSIGEDILYYSRRIGHAPSYYPKLEDNQTLSISDNAPILSALKLTGKTKQGLSVGLMQSITAKENATIYSMNSKTKVAVEPFTNFAVGRLKQDFNQGNTVLGGIITSTFRNIIDNQLKFLPKSAIVGGIDFQHNWMKRKYFVDFKGFYSDVRGEKDAISRLQQSAVHYYQRVDANHLNYNPERTSLSGWGGLLRGGKRSGKFLAIGTLNLRSPGLDFNDVGYLYRADLISQMVNLTYRVSKPGSIIRSYYIEFEQAHEWTFGGENKLFGGENTLDRFKILGYLQFNNLWNVRLNLKKNFNIFDTRELRGGPKLYKDGYNDIELFIQSNASRELFVGFGPRFKFFSDNISKTSYFTAYFRWQLNEKISISARNIFDHSIDNNKWLATKTSLITGKTNYLVGTIDRNTISSILRFEYFISPEISLQYYGNPYASIGKYTNFREVADASNRSLSERYTSLDQFKQADNTCLLKQNGNQAYIIKNPDFNFQEFRSNMVARWEFRPGSTLYLVWTNTRSTYSDQLDQSIEDSFGDILKVKSQNVFMVKFSYWFSL